MEKYLNALQGIAYYDWLKLKIGVDRSFEAQKNELERELKFANPEKARQFIQSQFGQTSG